MFAYAERNHIDASLCVFTLPSGERVDRDASPQTVTVLSDCAASTATSALTFRACGRAQLGLTEQDYLDCELPESCLDG